MATVQNILATLEAEQIRNISLWFTDITGTVKSITIPVQRLESIVTSGAHFDGSSIDAFAREAESDMLLVPDLHTFAIIPNDTRGTQTARLICNVHAIEGELYPGDPVQSSSMLSALPRKPTLFSKRVWN
ncbi:MAG UNVERIFIED_CONTAM: glutamine synthetase [Anaerolineae bacterium]|jgi:glutamine synthetase